MEKKSYHLTFHDKNAEERCAIEFLNKLSPRKKSVMVAHIIYLYLNATNDLQTNLERKIYDLSAEDLLRDEREADRVMLAEEAFESGLALFG